MEAFQAFLNSVPRDYHGHIRELEICTKSVCYDPYGPAGDFYDFDYDYEPLAPTDTDTDANLDSEGCYLSGPGSCSSVSVTDQLVEFLKPCVNIRKLALNIGGSPSNDIIPVFESFTQLRKLAISNWADENDLPMYVISLRLCFVTLRIIPAFAPHPCPNHLHHDVCIKSSHFSHRCCFLFFLCDDHCLSQTILYSSITASVLTHLSFLQL